MKKILITGITGFAGSHLAELLAKDPENQIIGTFLTQKSIENVKGIRDNLDLVQVDLTNADAVETLIKEKKPDVVYHLAALAAPGKSFDNPSEVLTNNIASQVNMLEAMKKADLQNTKILIVGSGDMYGLVDAKDLPMDEDTPFRPTNPYSVSKIAQDFLGLQYFLSFKMAIIRVRPFNHIGPRQATGFVVSDIAKKIAEIEKNKTEAILKVGNLEGKRDFTDVRDTVRAYSLLMEKGKAGDVYNIGSGVSHKLSEIVDKLLALSKVTITLQEDPLLMRPSDNQELLCDNTKMQQLTGWHPEIPLDKTLKDTLDYFRSVV